WPRLCRALELLDGLRQTVDGSLSPCHLLVRTVTQLQELLAQYKRQRGLISYEDMLTRVDENLDPARNPRAASLIRILRQRFAYAYVDEFQDTDPLQWRIFCRLFVEGGEGRLFVVGDPKQAIFGFRGADLEAYHQAVRLMKAKHGAQVCPLDISWRAS